MSNTIDPGTIETGAPASGRLSFTLKPPVAVVRWDGSLDALAAIDEALPNSYRFDTNKSTQMLRMSHASGQYSQANFGDVVIVHESKHATPEVVAAENVGERFDYISRAAPEREAWATVPSPLEAHVVTFTRQERPALADGGRQQRWVSSWEPAK